MGAVSLVPGVFLKSVEKLKKSSLLPGSQSDNLRCSHFKEMVLGSLRRQFEVVQDLYLKRRETDTSFLKLSALRGSLGEFLPITRFLTGTNSKFNWQH